MEKRQMNEQHPRQRNVSPGRPRTRSTGTRETYSGAGAWQASAAAFGMEGGAVRVPRVYLAPRERGNISDSDPSESIFERRVSKVLYSGCLMAAVAFGWAIGLAYWDVHAKANQQQVQQQQWSAFADVPQQKPR